MGMEIWLEEGGCGATIAGWRSAMAWENCLLTKKVSAERYKGFWDDGDGDDDENDAVGDVKSSDMVDVKKKKEEEFVERTEDIGVDD